MFNHNVNIGTSAQGIFGEAAPMSDNRKNSETIEERVRRILLAHWEMLDNAMQEADVKVSIYFPNTEDNFPAKFQEFMIIIISPNNIQATQCAEKITDILKSAFKEEGLDKYWIGSIQQAIVESRESPPTSPVFHEQKLPTRINPSAKPTRINSSEKFMGPGASTVSALQLRLRNLLMKRMQLLEAFVKSNEVASKNTRQI